MFYKKKFLALAKDSEIHLATIAFKSYVSLRILLSQPRLHVFLIKNWHFSRFFSTEYKTKEVSSVCSQCLLYYRAYVAVTASKPVKSICSICRPAFFIYLG